MALATPAESNSLRTLLDVLAATTPFLLLLLGAAGYLYRREHERRLAVEQQVSERKYQAYAALINAYFDALKARRSGRRLNEAAMVERMVDANKDLMLYGSDDVVRLYHEWLAHTRSGTVDLVGFGEILVAMRRDMGHPKTRITGEDVLRALITDFDEARARGDLQQRVAPTRS